MSVFVSLVPYLCRNEHIKRFAVKVNRNLNVFYKRNMVIGLIASSYVVMWIGLVEKLIDNFVTK